MAKKEPTNEAENPYRIALRRLKRAFLIVGFFSAAINVLMLTGPLYMLQVYDRVLSSGSVATLQGLFVIVVILYGFLGIYEALRTKLLSRASYRVDQAVGEAAFGFWLKAGMIENRENFNPVRDLDMVRNFLASPAILGLFDLPWIPIFLTVVFIIHPWLGWLTVFGALVVLVAAGLNRLMSRGPTKEAIQRDNVERSFVEHTRRNAEPILAMGMMDSLTARWRDMHRATLSRYQQGGDRSELFAAFSKAFRLLLQSALLTLGAFLALRQEISPGMIIATSIIAGRALAPVDQVIGHWRTIARAIEAHTRLKGALDLLPPAKKRVDLPRPNGHLKVINVTKLAPRGTAVSDRPRILERVNFELEPGDGLAVMGNSAAGKSSLARLLAGVWEPSLGEIRLDGATLDQWHPRELGSYIGYLPQRVEMLPGTIAENIARFDIRAQDKDVIEAAKAANIHEMILKMPDGYATHVGTSEQPLSGGQIQRLGLARALYGRPRLLILDEPNSNLDTKGSEALDNAIRSLRATGTTVIVMAHRASVVHAVNKILILHEGKLARFGPKEEIFQQAMQTVPSGSEVDDEGDVEPTKKSG
ncbi:type I secretion system permease/ATPase [Maritimibacter dapengensis]|uniref:Type I secretion system permease/ATPase n=1 Tax=Maritimibacter dapengensis TaxID=2836868 RepID=A0ABS6T3M9_9RHOB|nr:type I secretion system permease/ATPase [Maritimibacter dapengensis]MBV7379827.1 type I secretion system permease/ATPase [Maritimibacter dapengensis]